MENQENIIENSLNETITHTNVSRITSRLSQRRKAKGSSIILNSRQLQRYELNEDSETSIAEISMIHETSNSFDDMEYEKNDDNKVVLNEKTSIDSMNLEIKIIALEKIIKWYRRVRRINTITIDHYLPIWNDQKVDLLLSKLILGPRVRKLYNSSKIQSLITTIKDIENVLLDIYLSDIINDESIVHSPAVVIYRLEQLEELLTKGDSNLDISMADKLLIDGTIKEYRKLKISFYDCIFDNSSWIQHPHPGHWSLTSCIDNIQSTNTRVHTTRHKSIAIARNHITKSPVILEDHTVDILNNKILKEKDFSTKCLNKRKSRKAHIQVNIISADKLMPAKKGSALRDAFGEIIPDRKPGMKIELYLPNNTNMSSPGSDKSSIKKTYQVIREFGVTTLNPRWDSTVYLPIACAKQLITKWISIWEQKYNEPAVRESTIDSKCYEYICEELVKYWSDGFIKIQVVDGERFNEEIFLGEVTILLSSFSVPSKSTVANHRRYSTEISGSYNLNKINSTDRVSGSIHLNIYLHVPEIDYIYSIIQPNTNHSDASQLDITYDESNQNDSFVDEVKSNNNTPSLDRYRNHSKSKLKQLANKFQYANSQIVNEDIDECRPMTTGGYVDNDIELNKKQKQKKIYMTSQDDFYISKQSNESNVQTNSSKSASNTPLISNQITSRFTSDSSSHRLDILADISKCLENISTMQQSSDIVIDKINQKLLEKKKERLVNKQENSSNNYLF